MLIVGDNLESIKRINKSLSILVWFPQAEPTHSGPKGTTRSIWDFNIAIAELINSSWELKM